MLRRGMTRKITTGCNSYQRMYKSKVLRMKKDIAFKAEDAN
jgi:hypothetical protein